MSISRHARAQHVIFRFALRIFILFAIAAVAGSGVTHTLLGFASMASMICTTVALMRREPMFGPTLNHWDEGVAFSALFCCLRALA